MPVSNLIKKHFEPLKTRYKWGPNPFYYLAGKYGIHPTYIQEMLTIKMDNIEILEAIKQLKDGGGQKYDVNLVKSEFQKPIRLSVGKWSPKNKIYNREVLLVSSGPNFDEYKKDYGQTLICGHAKIGGYNVGVIANQKIGIETPNKETALIV